MTSPKKEKLIRITTVPISLEKLLENQLTFMNDYYDVIAVSSEETRLNKFGKDNNVKVKYIELTREITPVKDLKALWMMYRFLKNEKPKIVHTHTPKAGTIGMLAAKLAGVPVRMHTVAGLPLLEATGLKRKLLNNVEKLTYWAATKVYPNSNGLKNIIIQEKFCNPNKLKVISKGSSNGINTDFFDPSLYNDEFKSDFRLQNGIFENDFVFVFVGRLVGDKGINELVRAFVRLSENENNYKLLLVGPLETELDPLENSTLNLIDTNPNIISVGYQNDVRKYFAISDALVFPSYREGFPNVVLQASAMGLPSIVSDINGCNEIITNEFNGLIIPVKDSEAIFDAMKKMISNNVLYKTMELNARRVILESYQQPVVWNAILNEYNNLVKQ